MERKGLYLEGLVPGHKGGESSDEGAGRRLRHVEHLVVVVLGRKRSKREKGFTSFKQAQNVFTKLKLYLTASFNWFDFSFLFDTLDVMHQIHRLGRGFLLHQVTKTGVT